MPSESAALSPILERLRRAERKIRRAVWLWGGARLAAAALAYLGVVVGIDYLFPFGGFGHAILLALGLVLAGFGFRRWISQWLPRLEPKQLALYLDEIHPHAEDGWTTALDLPDAVTSAQIEALPDDRAVVKEKLRWPLAAAAAALICFGTLHQTTGWFRIGVSRLWPGSPVRWAYLDLDPARDAVARGGEFTLTGRVRGRLPRAVAMILRYPNGERQKLSAALRDGTFRFVQSNVVSPFSFQVRAGDSETDWKEVRLIDPPAVLSVAVRLAYPEYTGLPERRSESGEIQAVAGARAELTLSASKPLSSGMLETSWGEKIPLTIAGKQASAGLLLSQSGTYALKVVDTEGIPNDPPPRYRVAAVPDRPPAVRWTWPKRTEMKATVETALPLACQVEDDFGLSAGALRFAKVAPNPEWKEIPLPLASQEGRAHAETLTWSPAPYDLQPGDLVELVFAFRDRKEPEPNTGESPPLRVRIVSRADLAYDLDARLIQMREDLEESAELELQAGLDLGELARGTRKGGAEVSRRRGQLLGRIDRAAERFADIRDEIQTYRLQDLYPGSLLEEASAELKKLSEAAVPQAVEALKKELARPAGADWKGLSAQSEEIRASLNRVLQKLLDWEDFNGLVRLAGRSVQAQEDVIRQLKSR